MLREKDEARLDTLVERRLAWEPISRILGVRGFYGRDFEITAATLDPRPDTETMIEMVLGLVAEEGWHDRPLRILDIGTGSGCLIVTLLAELAQATGLGTDVSAAALAVAVRNAERHSVNGRVRWSVARALTGIEPPFDILVCNPPYIPTHEIDDLDPEVRVYDPRCALDGGADGLAVYRELLWGVSHVVPKGWIVLETGSAQADAVGMLMKERIAGGHAHLPRMAKDLGGRVRCVAQKSRL